MTTETATIEVIDIEGDSLLTNSEERLMSRDNGRTMSRRDRPLYRDTSDKMVAGVCSGLGRHFDIHTQLVRVAFVVFTLLGGAGVLAYLVLWFALDPKSLNVA